MKFLSGSSMLFCNRKPVATVGFAILMLLTCTVDMLASESLPREAEISATDVLNVMNNKDWVIVDARGTDAYNGWALDGVARGGHLPQAVDFPASWLDVDNEKKEEMLATVLRTKGIERNKHIVLYSTKQRDRKRVAAYLREAGFRNLYHFNFNDWVENEARPLVRYENFDLLVPAAVVKLLLEGFLPETFADTTRLKFIEVSWGGEDASYSKGHIARSFHVNTDHFEPPPQWKLGSHEVLTRFATDYGFQADDTVIVSGADPTASYRLAIVLRYMGVRDVRVLNGGFAAWEAAKYPIETKSNPPPKATSFGAKIPLNSALIVGIEQVKAGLRKPNAFMLVDNRTWAEFIGETSGYKYHVHKGRIPGSTYGQADFTGANSLTPYRNIDNTMRNADEILELWKKAGIRTDRDLCFMCGGGWRAAEVLTFARVIGIPNTSLYSDGWIGWSNNRTNPVESGAVPDTMRSPARLANERQRD